ncbi:hypothetical protein AVEN_177488-1 [Araneus ventricosus]|uniref:CCHC-type domain-containing protein n=1 Tax=Araneus ventricosus TaxID=182803 RepID=A0A4Y2D1K5_ARAVE|nr:hypothetical protein AVEN_177488-1 [Araneus ventricosus]
MKLAVRPYIPNPLRCFQCQHFGHSKASCRGTLTCSRCVEAGHENSNCTAPEKCVNCKGPHTSFPLFCSSWIFEKEFSCGNVLSYEVASTLQDLSGFQTVHNRKKLKKESKIKTNTQSRNPEKISQFYSISTRPISPKPQKDNEQVSKFCKTSPREISDSTPKPDIKSSDAKQPAKSITSSHGSNYTNYVVSNDPECLSVSALGNSSQDQSDTDTEMSPLSPSEDILDYDMSEDLEKSSKDVCTPPPSPKEQRLQLKIIIPTKYETR